MFSLHIVSDQPIGKDSLFINGKITSLWELRSWENLTLCVYSSNAQISRTFAIMYGIYISKLLFFPAAQRKIFKNVKEAWRDYLGYVP